MGISIRAYGRHRGVSEAAVRKAIRAGRITPEPDGTIDPAKADSEWTRNTDVAQQRGVQKRKAEERLEPYGTWGQWVDIIPDAYAFNPLSSLLPKSPSASSSIFNDEQPGQDCTPIEGQISTPIERRASLSADKYRLTYRK